MQLKTSGQDFRRYGRVYDEPIDPQTETLAAFSFEVDTRSEISHLHQVDSLSFIEVQEGLGLLLVGHAPKASCLDLYAIHRNVCLQKGVYFAFIALTPTARYALYCDKNEPLLQLELDTPYLYKRILPKVTVKEIVGYYYNIRNGGYRFDGEVHRFFELTFVDRGSLHTSIDGQDFVLEENDLIFYGPGQHHIQSIPKGGSCSYLTIMFDLNTDGSAKENFLFSPLFFKIFSYNKIIYTLIKNFIKESRSELPFRDSLLVTLLEELVVRELQSLFVESPHDNPTTEASRYYQNELLDKVLAYIKDNVFETLSVSTICKHFSLSRTSLQLLFKEYLETTPKRYISEYKLEKSCQMLREGQMTVTEIALSLGFSSIHYFSRVFAARYHMPPSEYAKQLFNPHS